MDGGVGGKGLDLTNKGEGRGGSGAGRAGCRGRAPQQPDLLCKGCGWSTPRQGSLEGRWCVLLKDDTPRSPLLIPPSGALCTPVLHPPPLYPCAQGWGPPPHPHSPPPAVDRDWAPPTHLGLGVTLGRQWAHRCPLLGRQGRPRPGALPRPPPHQAPRSPPPAARARVPGRHKESFVWAAHDCSPLCGNRTASHYQALTGGIKGRCRGRGGAVLTDRPYLAPRLWDTLSPWAGPARALERQGAGGWGPGRRGPGRESAGTQRSGYSPRQRPGCERAERHCLARRVRPAWPGATPPPPAPRVPSGGSPRGLFPPLALAPGESLPRNVADLLRPPAPRHHPRGARTRGLPHRGSSASISRAHMTLSSQVLGHVEIKASPPLRPGAPWAKARTCREVA